MDEADAHLVSWLKGSLETVEKMIGVLKSFYNAPPPPLWKGPATQVGQLVKDLQAQGVVLAATADPEEPVMPEDEDGLPTRHGDAEMAQYLQTPYGRNAVRLLVQRWQRGIWVKHWSQPAQKRPLTLARTFLNDRREFYGVPPRERAPKLEWLPSRLVPALIIHDYDGSGEMDVESLPDFLLDLDHSRDLYKVVPIPVPPPRIPPWEEIIKKKPREIAQERLVVSGDRYRKDLI